MVSESIVAIRREYAEAECEQAGLTPEQTELAVAAAMSAADDDIYSDDDWEQIVADCIQGVAESCRCRPSPYIHHTTKKKRRDR